MFGTYLVWYLLLLPSETHVIANMTSLRAIDGDTSYHSHESFSLEGIYPVSYVIAGISSVHKNMPYLSVNPRRVASVRNSVWLRARSLFEGCKYLESLDLDG